MKFWTWLARLCSAAFLALVVFNWLVHPGHPVDTDDTKSGPPAAPIFH
jgi:hypothetical protein